jgi:hypothetical protein
VRDNLTTPLVFANSSSNALNGGSADKVTYIVSLPSSGTWFLWGRFYYPSTNSNGANSFMAKLDTQTLKKLGNKKVFQTWLWDGDGNQEAGTPVGLPLGNLSSGNHTLVIEKREVTPAPPPRIDVVCLSKSGTTPPSDGQACAAGACPPVGPTTTTTTTTTTTLPPAAGALCVKAGGNSPAGAFTGTMGKGTQYTVGGSPADADPNANNLTTPLVFANSTSNASGENNDKVSYTINVPSTGTYFLWGRFYYPSTSSNGANSFFAKLDTGALRKFGNNLGQFQKWHWDGNGDTENGAPDAIALGTVSAGNHTITIEKREVSPGPQPRLDVFCLTDDGAAPPTDAEACALLGGCP